MMKKFLLFVLVALLLSGCAGIVEGKVIQRVWGVPDAYHFDGDRVVVDGTHCEVIMDVNGTVKTYVVDHDACLRAWAREGKTIQLDCSRRVCVLADE